MAKTRIYTNDLYVLALEFTFKVPNQAWLQEQNLKLIADTLKKPLKEMDGRFHKALSNFTDMHILVICSVPYTKSPAEVAQVLKKVASQRVKDEDPSLASLYFGSQLFVTGYKVRNPKWSTVPGYKVVDQGSEF